MGVVIQIFSDRSEYVANNLASVERLQFLVALIKIIMYAINKSMLVYTANQALAPC